MSCQYSAASSSPRARDLSAFIPLARVTRGSREHLGLLSRFRLFSSVISRSPARPVDELVVDLDPLFLRFRNRHVDEARFVCLPASSPRRTIGCRAADRAQREEPNLEQVCPGPPAPRPRARIFQPPTRTPDRRRRRRLVTNISEPPGSLVFRRQHSDRGGSTRPGSLSTPSVPSSVSSGTRPRPVTDDRASPDCRSGTLCCRRTRDVSRRGRRSVTPGLWPRREER